MATLNLEDYGFSNSESNIAKPPTPKLNPTLEVPELAMTPQEPFVVSESNNIEQEEEVDFSGLLQVKKPGRSNAVSSGYGKRKPPTKGASDFHDGLDIPLDPNTPLKPFGKGTVVFSGNRKAYGKSVGIDYGNGITVYLNHLNRTDLEVGDRVTADAILGLSGNTGVSTGPHVHVQALKDGVSIDPRKIFNEDPSKAGLALTIRGLIEDANVIEESSDDNIDFSGLLDSNQIETQKPEDNIDFSGVAPTTENGEIDTDILKFNPSDKPKEVGYGQLFKEGFAPHFKEMAQGVASVEQFRFKPRTKNPNEPGKPISFSLVGMNGKPPSLHTINRELARVLGLSDLNDKFKSDKSFATGKAGTPLVFIDNPDLRKNPDGTWQVTIPYGMPSGAVELVNAYARGGAKAFSEKRKELLDRSKIYQEDLEQQKLKHQRIQNFQKEHPYLALLIDPTKPIKRGLQDVALSEIQLMHSISMLPRALFTSSANGFDSKEYLDLVKEDAKTQIEIDKARATIPQEEILPTKILRAGTSAIGTLPRFAAIGKLGGWALPTLTYVENLHRGNTEAVKAALPMAVMVGSMRGLEKFIEAGGNPLDVFKRSEIANKDIIVSIKANSPGNYNFHLMSNLEPMGIPIRTIDFKTINPFQRQLVLRGTNALSNVGTTLAINPSADFDTLAEQIFIGLALPVGKGRRQQAGRFEQRSIINGDAYTLPDGSVLLRARVDEASGLVGGRIPREGEVPYYASSIEQNAPTSAQIGRQLSTSKIDIPGTTKTPAVHLSIDQAALNLLDLRRAYEQGTYIDPKASTTKIGKFNAVSDQRKQDLLSAIKILDEAIPKETQEYFAKNEAIIREAIRTNYENRIQKEEFVKGQKILRKPASQLTMDDVREYNSTPKTPTIKKSAIENFMQTTRRTMISVEEAGKRGLEANQKNKGTFNVGIDPSDIPYLVQIGIGKLGRKSLDSAEFIREMIVEYGEEFLKYGKEVYNQAKAFVDGVNSLTDAASNEYFIKKPPFRVADMATIKNVYYVGEKYLASAREEDIPIDKIIATQKGVRSTDLIKFGEEPNLAILEGKTDLAGNLEVPKAVKINDEYYLFDGHHRSSSEKIRGSSFIKGRVIDFNEVASGKAQTRIERARETFGETGRDNKWFTQEKQIEIRENFLKPPDASELQEGFTAASKWIAKNFSNLVQIAGFHVEDAYRRGVEPKIEDIVGRLRTELGDWIDSIPFEKWNEIVEGAKKFYQTNNADPFFSSFKQNVIEQFPEGSVKAETAKNIISKLGTKNEIEWTSGLQDWIERKIKSGERINKKELIDYIERNQVRVDEIVLGKNLTPREMEEQAALRKKANENYDDYEIFTQADRDRLDILNNRIFAERPTRYDLKTYTSQRLELEGGRNPKEVLLQVPKRFTGTLQENFDQYLREINARFEDGTLITNEEIWKRKEQNPEEYQDMYDQLVNDFQLEKDAIYSHTHWNQENVVAHFRANERETIDGNKVFHSEEFQSDWNQQGRKEGYIGGQRPKSNSEGLNNFVDEVVGREGNVPRNPFMENNWKELAFKRFLRMGVEMGKDGVSWTTARQQQERYKKVYEGKKITYVKHADGTYDLNLESNEVVRRGTIEDIRRLTNDEFITKLETVASDKQHGKFNLDEAITVKSNSYSDYDTYFVNLAKKIGKKFGAEYKIKEIETESTQDTIYVRKDSDITRIQEALEKGLVVESSSALDNYKRIEDITEVKSHLSYRIIEPKIEKVHYLEITPKMRDSILKEGQPLYGLSSTESLKPSTPTGIRNKLITRDAFDVAKNELTKSIQDLVDNEGGTQTVLNSGLNPDAFLDQIKLLYRGWQDFEQFSSSLTRKYGEKITPHIEAIWNWIKESKFNQDERGFFNFEKKKRLYTGEELTTFDDNRSSRLRNISIKAHRGIALAQTYESFGEVYNTLRGLQRTTNAYSTTILEQLSRAVSLLKKDTDQKVAQAIFARNREAINDPNEDANIIARFGLTPEQTRAYHYIRASISNVLDLRRDQLLYREHQNVAAINDQLVNLGLPTSGAPINAKHGELLTKLVDAYNKIQAVEDHYKEQKDSGYISLQRLGRYRAELENPNVPPTITVNNRTVKNPDRFLVDYADSPKEAQRRINEWKEQYNLTNKGAILDAKNPYDFHEISRKLTPGEFEELISGAGVRNTPEVEAIRAEVYEKYPTMGYQLKRKLYPGYRENNEFMIKSIAHQAETYASSYYNNLGREEGLRALENTGIETTDKDLWNVARQFIEDETSTPQYNNWDIAAYKARKFTYLMQLGYQVKQLYLNAFVQPVTQNYNYLARVENPTTGKRLGGITEVERTFIKGTKLSLQLAKAKAEDRVGIRKVRSPEFLEFQSIYNQLKNERVIEPEYTKSLLELEAEGASAIDSKFQSRTKNFFSWKQQEHWAGTFMRAGEHTTRTQMAASLFVAGKKFGLAGDALTDFIVRGIDSTQTNPSRGENPFYIRKIGEAGKLFYQFGAFRHMWFENLILNAKSDWKHKSLASTSRTIAPLAIMAGIKGLPLTGFAFTLYSLASGRNPDERLKRWVKNKLADNDYLESLALYGFTGSAGFSQSTGIQMPVVDNLAEQLTEDSWWDKIFSNNVPALMTTKQIGQGLAGASAAAYDGDTSKIIAGIAQALPFPGNRPMRDLVKAQQAYEEGYKTKSGDTILSKNKVTAGTLAGQILGITPNEISEFYNRKRYKKLRTSDFGKATRRTYRKLTR